MLRAYFEREVFSGKSGKPRPLRLSGEITHALRARAENQRAHGRLMEPSSERTGVTGVRERGFQREARRRGWR